MSHPQSGIDSRVARTTAIGCMRLSTDPRRDDARSEAILHAALDAGVRLLDTADVYCLGESDEGHNERLIARALASWSGPRGEVRVVTKGGLRRAGARWLPDGRARHLEEACAASARALGVEVIDLYLLHAIDPAVPLATSVRALAGLLRSGRVRAVGLCNVGVAQIEEAEALVEIAAVQVPLSLAAPATLLAGVVEHCSRRGIPLLGHSPLGGPRGQRALERNRALHELAADRGVTAAQLSLSALRDLDSMVIPLPGVTRIETARAAGALGRDALTMDDRAALDACCPELGALRRSLAGEPAPASTEGEVVLLMGMPGAGKTTAAQRFVESGYARLNRDVAGGKLVDILPALARAAAQGGRRFVLDNTYPTRASRRAVIEVARRHALAVRCVFVDTPLGDAQVNAVSRMIAKHGRLLPPEEMRRLSRSDPNSFAPAVQFRFRRELEAPRVEEGFTHVDVLPFARARDTTIAANGRAVICELDGVLRCSKSGARTPRDPDDVALLPGRVAALARWRAEGYVLAVTAWLPELADGTRTPETIAACLRRTEELLGFSLDVRVCPHAAGPPVCWCRKPLPGLGVLLCAAHQLDPARSLVIGDGPADRGFAERLGFTCVSTRDAFSLPPP